MYQTKYRRSYLRKVVRWWSLWQIPEHLYGKKRNLYVIYTYLYIILRFVKQYYLYLGVILFLCRTLWLSMFQLICIPYALVDYSCSLCLSYLLKPRIKLFYKLLHFVSHKRETNFRINFMLSKEQKQVFIAKWWGQNSSLFKRESKEHKSALLCHQARIKYKTERVKRWTFNDINGKVYQYISVIDGKIANSGLIYRCMTYLFILLKTSIYHLTSQYSYFFLYKQMSGWYFLLSQVKVISSLSGFSFRGTKLTHTSNQEDSSMLGGQTSHILRTILGLFHVWSLFRRKFKQVIFDRSLVKKSFKLEMEDDQDVAKLTGSDMFLEEHKDSLMSSKRQFLKNSQISAVHKRKAVALFGHKSKFKNSQLPWSPFWTLSKQFEKLKAGHRLSNWFSYCGHKAYFYYRARFRSLFFRLQEYSDVEYADKYLFKSIFSFINHMGISSDNEDQSKDKLKSFYIKGYKNYLNLGNSNKDGLVIQNSWKSKGLKDNSKVYRNLSGVAIAQKRYIHTFCEQEMAKKYRSSLYLKKRKQLMFLKHDLNTKEFTDSVSSRLSEKLMQSLISTIFSSKFRVGSHLSKNNFLIKSLGGYPYVRVSQNQNRGSQYLISQMSLVSKKNSVHKCSGSFSFFYKLWRFFLNSENRVFFLKFFFQKSFFQKQYRLNTISFDYLSFFYNNFSQGTLSSNNFIRRRYRTRWSRSPKPNMVPVALKQYVTKVISKYDKNLVEKSLFHFFKTYNKFYSGQFAASVSFFDHWKCISNAPLFHFFKKVFCPYMTQVRSFASGGLEHTLSLARNDKESQSLFRPDFMRRWFFLKREDFLSSALKGNIGSDRISCSMKLPVLGHSPERRIRDNLYSIFLGRMLLHQLGFLSQKKSKSIGFIRLNKYVQHLVFAKKQGSQSVRRSFPRLKKLSVDNKKRNDYIKAVYQNVLAQKRFIHKKRINPYIFRSKKPFGGFIRSKSMRYSYFRWIRKKHLGLFKWKVKEQVRFFLKKRRRRWYRRLGKGRNKRYFKLLKRCNMLQKNLRLKQSQYGFLKTNRYLFNKLVSSYKVIQKYAPIISYRRNKLLHLSKKEILANYISYFQLCRLDRFKFVNWSNFKPKYQSFILWRNKSALKHWKRVLVRVSRRVVCSTFFDRKNRKFIFNLAPSSVGLKQIGQLLSDLNLLERNSSRKQVDSAMSVLVKSKKKDPKESSIFYWLHSQLRYRVLKLRLSIRKKFHFWCFFYYGKLLNTQILSVNSSLQDTTSHIRFKDWFLRLWIRFYWKSYLWNRLSCTKSRVVSKKFKVCSFSGFSGRALLSDLKRTLRSSLIESIKSTRWNKRNKSKFKLKYHSSFYNFSSLKKKRQRKIVFYRQAKKKSQRFRHWFKYLDEYRSISSFKKLKSIFLPSRYLVNKKVSVYPTLPNMLSSYSGLSSSYYRGPRSKKRLLWGFTQAVQKDYLIRYFSRQKTILKSFSKTLQVNRPMWFRLPRTKYSWWLLIKSMLWIRLFPFMHLGLNASCLWSHIFGDVKRVSIPGLSSSRSKAAVRAIKQFLMNVEQQALLVNPGFKKENKQKSVSSMSFKDQITCPKRYSSIGLLNINRGSWSKKNVRASSVNQKKEYRQFQFDISSKVYSNLIVRSDSFVSVFSGLFKSWIKRYFYLTFYRLFQNVCLFQYFNYYSISESADFNKFAISYFMEYCYDLSGIKKFKNLVFDWYNLKSYPKYGTSRYLSFPYKGTHKSLMHTRRRWQFLFQLGLKACHFTGHKYASLISSGEHLLTQMFSGIPSYVFSQATGKEVTWEDLFYAGSLKQWWSKLVTKWRTQSNRRKTKIVGKTKLPWIPWKGRKLRFPWSKSGRKKTWRPTHNLTSMRKFSQSFPGILAVSGLSMAHKAPLRSNSVYKWFHGSNTLFGKLALSVFNLDFHRSIHFNAKFFSTSWMRQMYASHSIRGFFNKQSFWMPLGIFQVWNEICLHFFSFLVFIFKYISIPFPSLGVIYSQLFLYLYFCFKDIIGSSKGITDLELCLPVQASGALSESYFLVQNIFENTLRIIFLLHSINIKSKVRFELR